MYIFIIYSFGKQKLKIVVSIWHAFCRSDQTVFLYFINIDLGFFRILPGDMKDNFWEMGDTGTDLH